MYQIIFYRDARGHEPVYEHLKELSERTDKSSRIRRNKWNDCIQALAVYGTRAGEKIVKHLEGDIWELRPFSDRILFAAWIDGSFVLLHHFQKKTRKTPRKEIEQAKRAFADFKERSR